MKQKMATLLIFLITLAVITTPLVLIASSDTDNFDATVTLDNSAPVITWVDDSVSEQPNEGGEKNISISFNVTDQNTVDDLDDASAYVNITSGSTERQSFGCGYEKTSGNEQRYTCNITIEYYDANGAWTIEAWIEDNSGSSDMNDTETFTVQSLDAINAIDSSITFQGAAGSTVGETNNPVTINNTGNRIYQKMNITGYELDSATNVVLGIGNFTVNISDGSGSGQKLLNGTDVWITDSNLTRGVTGQEDLYLYVDIPAGLEDDTYTSKANWVVESWQLQ